MIVWITISCLVLPSVFGRLTVHQGKYNPSKTVHSLIESETAGGSGVSPVELDQDNFEKDGDAQIKGADGLAVNVVEESAIDKTFLIEDDMIVGEYVDNQLILDPYFDGNDDNELVSVEGATSKEHQTWPQAGAVYNIPYTSTLKNGVLEPAIAKLNLETSIRLIPRTSQADYIEFFKGTGCYSAVGKVNGKQPISIGDNCDSLKTVLHEIMHALGFLHEHQRSDRDDYIQINYENILDGFEHAFEKGETNNETPYDFTSVMHYPRDGFSSNYKDTITPKSGYTLAPVATDLSSRDIQAINEAYPATNFPTSVVSPSPTSPKCANEGQTCTCSGTVYYGRRYVSGSSVEVSSFEQLKTSAFRTWDQNGPQTCSNANGDPLPGILKQCLCQGH